MTEDGLTRSEPMRFPSADERSRTHNVVAEAARCAGVPLGYELSEPPSAPVAACVRFILCRFGEEIMLQDMAYAAGLNRDQLARRFRREMGVPPVAFLHTHRTARAIGLLACTDRPVAEIARSVGYRRVGAFSRAFHRVTGLYPQVHRRISARVCRACALSERIASRLERPFVAWRSWRYTDVVLLRYTDERPEAANGAIMRRG